MTVACCFFPCRMRVNAASMCKPKSCATAKDFSARLLTFLPREVTGCSAVKAFFARVASLRHVERAACDDQRALRFVQ